MRPHLFLSTALLAGSTATVLADEALTRPVDLALVLLTDVSKSVDNREYAIVKDGYKAAFADPRVVEAILRNPKGVAVAYVEFSGRDEFTVVKGWDVLTDAASARSFGEAVAIAPRTSSGNTALAVSLKKAADMLTVDAAGAARRVIDVASDHPNDDGRSGPVRDLAVAAGITINALPIIEANRMAAYDGHLTYPVQQWGFEDSVAFYRNHVIGGPGSFLIEVHDYAAFGEALKRKLLRELISSSGDDSSETFALAD
ncbi:MAG TPA: DUF1194 domain-containing protein [Dongiaceae bacterium]|nr:DUF1194 domain-containing protein [Dongiaceae bacterium]